MEGLRLDDEDLRAVEEFLCLQPDYGNIIKGAGGLRKLRWGLKGSGKRGGMRILYVDFPVMREHISLVCIRKTSSWI